MEHLVFQDLLIVLGLSIVVLLIGYQFRIPPVVGFILTGVLTGPYGLRLVHEMQVEHLAQIGIVLLMFGIGMEFSFKKLVQIRRLFLLGGSLQVGLTVLAGYLIGTLLGRPWGESIFLGCLLSMSSTAIVLRVLEQLGESASPQGKISISILIFQDMIAIPMILLTPFLGTHYDVIDETSESSLWLVAKGIAIVIGVFFCAQKIVPRLLLLVARTRNKELFLLTVLSLCFGVAWFTSSLGLSLTIGAFLAGLIISESEYSNEAIGHIFPFQALFISFFFISIGMLLDLHFVLAQPIIILVLAVIVLLLKAFIAGSATLLLGMPMRTAILVGMALSQVGEFSFVLAKTGIPYGLGSQYYYQLFLAVAILTLSLSPAFINLSATIANFASSLPLPKKLKTGFSPPLQENGVLLQDHVIIVGFGVSGKNLAHSSKLAGIPYTILEMNPDTVKEQKKHGEPIHFGDATHEAVLEHLQIHEAKAMAILINDPIAARRVVRLARSIKPNLYIIVRARYVNEMPLLSQLGADEVIPDEFGTSVEVFSRVLKQYFIPQDEIEKFVNDIRADGYEIFRNQSGTATPLSEMRMNLAGMEISSYRLYSDSLLVGKTLQESELRKRYGLTVLLIKRNSLTISNPAPDTILMTNDLVVLVGEKLPSTKLKELFGKAEIQLASESGLTGMEAPAVG